MRPNRIGLEAHMLCRAAVFQLRFHRCKHDYSAAVRYSYFCPYQHTSEVLTETRPLYSHYPYQTSSKAFVLTQTPSYTLLATRPDFCSTSNLRCRLLMEQAIAETCSLSECSCRCVSPVCRLRVCFCFWQVRAVLAVRSRSMGSHCVIGFNSHVV